jgi:hypothetical protein
MLIRARRRSTALSLGAGVVLASRLALAEPASPLISEETTARARREYVAATDHVKEARWGEALAAFERSEQLRPHPLTTYNIGACERALGRYTRAQAALRRALAANEAAGGKELPASFATEAKAWLDEIEGVLARVAITLAPDDAELLVDGRAVQRSATLVREGDGGVFEVGSATGKAVPRPGASLTLLLDPGSHLFSVSKKGFASAAITRSFGPGATATLPLDLRKLPALIRVSTNQPGAVVMLGGVDVGAAPVEISRLAGSYPVLVRKPGYVSYAATVDVKAGEEANLRAVLVEQATPLYQKTWFWTVAVGVVAGAVTATYLATRPALERPAPDGGGLGWVVKVPPASR